MARGGIIGGGIILMVLGAGGTIFALPFVEQTACSGQGLFGSLAQLNERNQEVCAENRMYLWGAVALGIVGIGLLVGGAVMPSKKRTWICEFCNYATSTEAEMINHKNQKHLAKSSAYVCEHCDFFSKTEEELWDHYNENHPKEKKW